MSNIRTLHRRRLPLVLGILMAALCCAGQAQAAEQLRLMRHYNAKRVGKLDKGALLKVQGYAHLSLEQYRQLRTLGTDVLSRFSPERHIFVGVGRAPAALVAFLRQLSPEIAYTYPAGGLSGSLGADAVARLQAAHSQHFAQLLAKPLSSGKDIVLLDRALTGTTLVSAKQLLENHLRQTGSKAKVSTAGISEKSIPSLDAHLDVSALDELQKLHWHEYEVVAPYAHHDIGRPHQLADLQPRQEFDKYQTALVQRMSEDPQLDAFLAATFPAFVTAAKDVTKAAKPVVAPKKKAPIAKKKIARRKETTSAAPSTKPRLTLNYEGQTFGLLSDAEYHGLRDATAKLLAAYPPSQYYYLGVGRTSAPFVAMLHHLNPRAASKTAGTLPADSLGKGIDKPEAFNEYFDRLPAAVLNGTKKVLLFRRASSSKSLSSVAALLQQRLQQYGVVAAPETLGISTRGKAQKGWIDVSASTALTTLLDSDAYKAMSPSPYFRIGHSKPAELTYRSEFTQYDNTLQQLMAADPQIAKLLSAFSGQ